jgi:M6 family metalloprotease-like protein
MRKSWLRIGLVVLFLLVWQPVFSTAHTPTVGAPAHQPETTAITQAAQQAIAQAYPQGLEKAAAASAAAPGAMPPNPRLLDKIKSGQVRLPTFTDQISRPAGGAKAPGVSRQGQLTGQVRTLVLLVDFSDVVKTVNASYFDTLLFAAPVTGRGSLKDYFSEVSYGAVDIVTVNLPSSTGWKRAPNTLAYYDNNNYCTDGSYPNNCQKLAEDLIDAVSSVVDFSQYDNDGDGSTEPILIVHSGPGAEFTGNTSDIWSHSWQMANPRTYNGKTISKYTIQPEYWQTVNATTSDMTIGVFAHEMGHAFWNLPDLYDRDKSSEGVGSWSLMGSGGWNGQLVNGNRMGESPAWPDAWSRIQMGFTTPATVTINTTSLSLPQTYNNGATSTVYKLGSTVMGPQEYYLLENREQTANTYDEYLPGQGLLIWHVDEAIGTQNDVECTAQPHSSCPTGQHYKVALEQADGLRHLELNTNSGDAADSFPGTGNNRSWTFLTNPESSSWYATTDSFISVTNISTAGASMTANVNTGLATPGTLSAVESSGQVNLTWADTSADETNFRIDRMVDGGSWSEIASAVKNSSSYADKNVLCNRTYTYRVRAYRNVFGGEYTPYTNTAVVTPTTCLPPGAFGKSSPANYATGQPRAITLTWGISNGAASYEYCYDTISTGDCTGTWTSNGAATTTSPILMPAGTIFYWQVRARNTTNLTYADGSSSAKWRFDVQPDPAAFNKKTPTNGATGQLVDGLVLSWETSTNAVSYEYCYATSTTCPTNGWKATTSTSATLTGLTRGTTYYWQVRAKNPSATVDANGGWWSFATSSQPGSFVKLSPGNMMRDQKAVGLVISWGASTGATYYEYCLNSAAKSCAGAWVSAGASTSATLPTLTTNTTYYWQVRAQNGSGIATEANSGTWWEFSVPPAPGAFTKTTPINNATAQPIDGLVLTWAKSANGTKYEYCFYTTTTCPTNGWVDAALNTTATLNGLTPSTTYYWQVRASNANGTVYADSNAWFSFFTIPPPGSFSKTLPTDGATNQHVDGLVLTWQASPSATVYDYCLNKAGATCPNDVWTSVAGGAQTITLNGLTGGAKYYWQVRARNSSGSILANTGTWWTFTTQLTPEAFTKTTPIDNAVDQPINKLQLTWKTSTNATQYEYCVSTSYGTCPGTWTTAGINLFATVNDLTAGTVYYWQVRAVNTYGSTDADGGTWFRFDTMPTPGYFQKTNLSYNPSLNIWTIEWGASTLVDSYEYCLSTTDGFCPNNLWTTTGTDLTADLSGLASGITYYWQARARNANGTTEADGGYWWGFTTNSLPGAFQKTSPADGIAGQSISSIWLDWTYSDNYYQYEYCVSTTPSCSGGVWTSTSSYSPGVWLNNLNPGTTYYWQVRARNSSGTTEADTGTWWSFTTTAYPGPFTKTSPTDTATGQPKNNLVLNWGASSSADSYEYCYNSSPTCPGNIWTVTGTTRTATIGGLSAGTTYYWQVRARNIFGDTYADNRWFTFTTQPLPSAFTRIAPVNGATGQLINSLSISWNSATNATSYEYCLSTSGASCPGSWTNTAANLSATLPTLSGGTTYYWQVRAINTNGSTEATGGWWTFTTLSLPGSFSKTDPASAATGQLTNGLILNWGASSSATSYEYCYNSSATCAGDHWTSANTALTATVNSLNPGATYYWQVRAKNANGITYANNAWWSFTTLQLPGNFTKTTPSNGATGQAISGLALNWGTSSNASGYQYCVSTSATCPINGWIDNGTSRTVTLSTLASGATYYWQVRAWNVYGTTDSDGGWFTFTTQNSASSFNKSAPTNGATGQLISGLSLSWASSASATSYEYCTSSAGPACPSDWTTTGAALSATLNNLQPNTLYYWQVRARNSGGTTDANGGWWTFTTSSLPGGFNKSGPTNGATGQLNNSLNLIWGASSNVTSYEYCYDTTNDNTCGSTWTTTGTTLSATLGSLSINTTYYWQVRARNASGTTDANSGVWWNFTTLSAGGTFGKSSPAQQATQQPTSGLALNWGASSGATGYEYCYSKTTTCSPWYSTGTAQTTTLNGLTSNTTYYWHVRASNGTTLTYSDGAASAMWQFTTTGTPKVYLPLVIGPPPVYTIAGRITFNGAGLGGLTVNLTGSSSASVTTNSGGYYSFTVLAGSFTVTPSSSDYVISPASRNISVPPSISGQDFTATTACTQLLYDRGFESQDGSWYIYNTPYLAGYSNNVTHSGSWSLRSGIEPGGQNTVAYSSASQMVSVPSVLSSATLEFYLYPFSGETASAPIPQLTIGMSPQPVFDGDQASTQSDAQWALLLDEYDNVIQQFPLLKSLSNSKTWEHYSFDLSGYRGRTIQIYFSTYNNGAGGLTGMYVDDTSLQICP